MSLISELLEKPATLSAASKYTAMNSYVCLGAGAVFILWPGVETLFRDAPLAGNEVALLRVIGMVVAVIGWLYLFGGRSGGRQDVAASVLDRWASFLGYWCPWLSPAYFLTRCWRLRSSTSRSPLAREMLRKRTSELRQGAHPRPRKVGTASSPPHWHRDVRRSPGSKELSSVPGFVAEVRARFDKPGEHLTPCEPAQLRLHQAVEL